MKPAGAVRCRAVHADFDNVASTRGQTGLVWPALAVPRIPAALSGHGSATRGRCRSRDANATAGSPRSQVGRTSFVCLADRDGNRRARVDQLAEVPVPSKIGC